MTETITPTRPSLVIERLGIDRMDGISGSFEIERLVSGINVIHGPNASGKSRTSTAIQALIWPDLAESGADLSGDFSVSGTRWRVDIDHAGAVYQQNGAHAPAPALGIASPDQSDRYLLTLHGLLQADNKQFAKIIQQESAGGYDLNAARAATGMGPASPRLSHSKAKRAYDEATAQTTQLRRNDQQLKARERSRGDLDRELDAANIAAARVRLFESALEHAEAVTARKAAEVARDAFEDPIGRMTGEEFDRLQAHMERVTSLQRQLAVVEADIARHEQALEEAGFTGDIPPTTLLSRLNGHFSSLKVADSELESMDVAMATSRVQLQQARDRIASGITDQQLRELDSNGLRKIADLTRRFRDALDRERAEAELAAWVGNVEAPANQNELRLGIELLAKRLRLGDPDEISQRQNLLKWALIWAAIVIVIEAALLAVVSNPASLALALFSLPLVWLALRRGRLDAAEVAGRTEQDFAALGLGAPMAWTPDQIEPLFETLLTQFAAAILDEQKSIKWEALANRRQEASRIREEIETTRRTQVDEIGVTAGSDEPEEIRLIADAIDGWRKASDEVVTGERRIATIRNRRATVLAELNRVLGGYAVPEVLDRLDAETQVEALQRRVTLATEARNDLQTCRRKVSEQVQPAIDGEREAIHALFTALDFESHDVQNLRDLCGRVEACKLAQSALLNARVVEQTMRLPLINDPNLADSEVAEIEAELAAAGSRAGEHDGILERITGLKHDLRRARRQTSLEESIAVEAQALDQLRASRAADYASVAGWQLAEFIQRETRDLNRPRVFHTARDLFSRFTAGAWRLELSDGADPVFTAVETSTGRGHTLDKLSSGTRVQLLMAVRVGFLEVSEQGPQLPLILDEALGNTDDIRANAIIDATIEIARRGRQVVYFTAQHDEIGKWHARAEQTPDAPALELIDFAEARGIANANRPAQIKWDRAIVEPAVLPAGITHQGARIALHVAAFNPWSEHLDGVDLWYVITDLAALTRLRQHGIVTWGQYRQLREHDNLPRIDAFDEINARCEARLLLIDAVRRSWQRGRPKPLNRELLLASGAISVHFANRLTDLAKSLDWNAGAIVQALRAKKLDGFRRKLIDEMDEHFRANGFISETAPIDDEVIRSSALSAMRETISSGVIDEVEIEVLLQNLGSPGVEGFAANQDQDLASGAIQDIAGE